MKLLLILTCCLFCSCASVEPPHPALSVFEEGAKCWNDGDLEGYLATYADSDEVRWVSGGRVVFGKKAIAQAYRSRFTDAESMGELAARNLKLELATEADAMIYGEWHHRLGEIHREGVFTVHIKKMGNGRRIVSDHSSVLVSE